MRAYSRRRFLIHTSQLSAAAALCSLPAMGADTPANGEKMRAAVIGHTGHGNYGHGLDMIFAGLPNVEVVAVADADASGLEKAAVKIKAPRKYADYREMLEKERPQLVSVAPRWTDQHYAMGMAALRVGAHVFMEKPFAQNLVQADELLATADKAGRRIVVAHQMRLSLAVQHLKQAMDGGLIGELVEMRAHGKQDKRAGGEDMVVLGTHLFDLMRFFAGDATWCAAQIRQSGREATLADVHAATEKIGPIVGDEIDAQFAFGTGITGTFTSRGKLKDTAGDWGIDLIGTKGVAKIKANPFPITFVLKSGKWNNDGEANEWRHLDNDPAVTATAAERGSGGANRRLVDDWLDAIEHRREPVCSGRNAMKSLEMIMGVFEAGITKRRVAFPMTKREHPLGTLKES